MRTSVIIVIALIIVVGGAIGFIQFSQSTPQPASQSLEGWRESPDGQSLYRNTRRGFSLFYPSTFTVERVKESALGTSFLFKDSQSDSAFQVYVVNYEHDLITEEQFLLDVPTGVRESESLTTLGGTKAIRFYSEAPGGAKTIEVWAIHGGELFELSGPRESEKLILEVADSWEFL